MQTNILKALTFFLEKPNNDLPQGTKKGKNRMNSKGEALEEYVKNFFLGVNLQTKQQEKDELTNKLFSYIGNQNNPPDIMLRGGDAIEVKKIESSGSDIALNSSYPKDKIYASSPMITETCRACESWEERDVLYVIGVVDGKKIKTLWFIYGNCYAANREVYERVKQKISEGVNELKDVELSVTKEIGRVNRVDPLGITYLRIRGMWGIASPLDVFHQIISTEQKDVFTLEVIMLKEKYQSFPKIDQKNIERKSGGNFKISDIKIKSPNNPAVFLEAKHLSFKM